MTTWPYRPSAMIDHRARALGHPDVIAPPSFLMIISLEAERKLVYDPAFGIGDPRRLVHREQRFAHCRPAHAGDRLTLREARG